MFFVALIITASLGTHAFYRHKREAEQIISARRFYFWFYALIFLLISLADFAHIRIIEATASYGRESYAVLYAGAIAMISYIAVICGLKDDGQTY